MDTLNLLIYVGPLLPAKYWRSFLAFCMLITSRAFFLTWVRKAECTENEEHSMYYWAAHPNQLLRTT